MSEWTEAKHDELRALWMDRSKSGAELSLIEIGRRLGVSKNAVAGKAHRLNLPPRPSPIRRDGMKRPATPRVYGETLPLLPSMKAPDMPPMRAPIVLPAPAPVVPAVRRRPVAVTMSSRVKPCAFPMWPHNTRPGPDPWFCDAPIKAGSVYCPEHSRKCFSLHRDLSEDAREAMAEGARVRNAQVAAR